MRFLLNAADCISFTQVEESLYFFHAHLNGFGKDELPAPHQRETTICNSNLSMAYAGALSFTAALSSEAGVRMFPGCLQTDALVHLLWNRTMKDSKERIQGKGGSPRGSNTYLSHISFGLFCFVFLTNI